MSFTFTTGYANPFSGIRFFESDAMVESIEDWSRCRSPSRARRRLAKGHKQHMRVITKPRMDFMSLDGGKTFYVHPEAMNLVRQQMKNDLEKRTDQMLLDALMGTTPAVR